MAYSITTTNGNLIATVNDATINTTATALTLIGRDYAGYGAFLNENFVYLLENFASTSEPTRKLTGQIWYDTSVNTLKVWNTALNQWKPISSSLAQVSTPSALTSSQGDLWFDTANNQLHAYNNGWQLIGPPSTTDTSGNTSGAIVDVIKDSSDVDHVVIKFYVSNAVVAIISNDAAFTPKNGINGYSVINPGFNLIGTSATAGSQITGDASNALKLNGVGAGQFLRSDQNTSTAYQLGVGNLVVGSSLSLVEISANSEVQINSTQPGYNLNFYANVSGSQRKVISVDSSTAGVTFSNSATITETLTAFGGFIANSTSTLVGITTLKNDLRPQTDGSSDIGNVTTRFANVHAVNLVGTLTGNVTASSVTVGNVSITSNAIVLGSSTLATQTYVSTYVQTAGQNSQGTKIISTSPPSGTGTNGDIWYHV